MTRASRSERLQVLVVDDERSIRTALSRELSADYDVIAVPGVEEAFAVLGQRLELAAVVSDLVMREPDDGYVLLEAVRLLRPRCARILVSATANGEWYIKNGTAQRFLEKPWEPGAVLRTVLEVIGSGGRRLL